MQKVRLSDFEVNEICSAFKENFFEDDHLWLFGSRVDLTKSGGDIDLFIESTMKNASLISKAKRNFLSKLYVEIGEQKIDVVVKFDETDLLIYKIAKKQGVQLV